MRKIALFAALLCLGATFLLLRPSPLEGPGGSPSLSGSPPPLPAPRRISRSGHSTFEATPTRPDPVEQDFPALSIVQTQDCWDRCGSPCLEGQEAEPACPEPCTDDSSCSENELCAPTERMGAADVTTSSCQKSHCQTDADCLEDRSCLPFARPSGQINLCIKTGGRIAGQPCARGFGRIARCNPGLLCTSGTCSLASCSSDEECGPAARCIPFAGGGYGCDPYCEDSSDCPDDNVCWSIGIGDGAKRCIHKVALGCLVDGCEDNSKQCVVDSDTVKSSYYATSCVSYCDTSEDCAPTEVCGTSIIDKESQRCYQTCTEGQSCPGGYICAESIVMSNETPTTACVRYPRTEELEFYSSFEE